MTPCFNIKGLAVDLIRELWDRGLYRDNKWLKMCHEAWFQDWVDYRTCLTMQDVDRQIEELLEPSGVDKPIIIEHEPDGSKAQELLGGELEIRAPWYNPEEK